MVLSSRSEDEQTLIKCILSENRVKAMETKIMVQEIVKKKDESNFEDFDKLVIRTT